MPFPLKMHLLNKESDKTIDYEHSKSGDAVEKAVRYFLVAFAVLFAADGLISVTNDVISFYIPNILFSKIREILAFSVLALTLPYLVAIFYFKFRKPGIIWLPFIFNVVIGPASSLNIIKLVDESSLFTIFALELSPHWVYQHHIFYFCVQTTFSLLQVFVAYHFGKEIFALKDASLEKDFRYIKAASMNAFFVLFFVSIQVITMLLVFNVSSKGFLVLSPTSVISVEKTYVKNGKTIHLIPMVHVGSESFYKDVSQLDGTKPTLVLLEGVKDKNNLLESFSYRNKVTAAQVDHFDPKATSNSKSEAKTLQKNIKYIVADLDASEFDPKTRKYLNKMAKKLETESFFQFIIDPQTATSSAEIMTWTIDILDRRNMKVLTDLKENESKFERFYIPWGALHMPDIEREILNQGYKLAETKQRSVISFEDIFAGKTKRALANTTSNTPLSNAPKQR